MKYRRRRKCPCKRGLEFLPRAWPKKPDLWPVTPQYTETFDPYYRVYHCYQCADEACTKKLLTVPVNEMHIYKLWNDDFPKDGPIRKFRRYTEVTE